VKRLVESVIAVLLGITALWVIWYYAAEIAKGNVG